MNGAIELAVDAVSLRNALRALTRAGREASAAMRAESKDIAGWLARMLIQSAHDPSAPPQAALVAKTVRPTSDRVPVVVIGGAARVGRPYRSRKKKRKVRAPAGALLWGSEHGSRPGARRRFVVGHNPAGYWIEPTVTVHADDAVRRWNTALGRVLDRAGLDPDRSL